MARGGAAERVTVYPSEIHEYVYCPRLYFFTLYMGRRRGIRERIRLLLGSLFHLLKSVPDRMRGFQVEERIEVSIGGVRLRGRPDAYNIAGDSVTVIERKSSRPPRRGVWLNDAAQASAYGLMLARREGSGRSVRLRIEYPTVARESELDSEKVALVLRVLDEIVLVKKYGVLPSPRPSPGKCSRCPFRLECQLLEEEKPEGDLYEPGSWLEGYTDDSFQ